MKGLAVFGARLLTVLAIALLISSVALVPEGRLLGDDGSGGTGGGALAKCTNVKCQSACDIVTACEPVGDCTCDPPYPTCVCTIKLKLCNCE